MERRKDYRLKPKKFCERCEAPLVPHIFSGREESYGMFMKRRFCSLACANTRGKKGRSRTQMLVQARAIALKEACECCGGTERLAIHHVNENWRDNRPENLQTLCVNCHQQWHGLHRKLGIKTFARMPPIASMPVRFYTRIQWGGFDPRDVFPVGNGARA